MGNYFSFFQRQAACGPQLLALHTLLGDSRSIHSLLIYVDKKYTLHKHENRIASYFHGQLP